MVTLPIWNRVNVLPDKIMCMIGRTLPINRVYSTLHLFQPVSAHRRCPSTRARVPVLNGYTLLVLSTEITIRRRGILVTALIRLRNRTRVYYRSVVLWLFLGRMATVWRNQVFYRYSAHRRRLRQLGRLFMMRWPISKSASEGRSYTR